MDDLAQALESADSGQATPVTLTDGSGIAPAGLTPRRPWRKSPQPSIEFTSPSSDISGVGVQDQDIFRGDRADAATREENLTPEPSFRQGLADAWDHSSVSAAAVRMFVGESFSPVPGYNPQDDKAMWEQATQGLAPEQHIALLKAESPMQLSAIANDLQSTLSQEANLRRMGKTGIALQFGVAVADPAMWVTVPAVGTLNAISKAGRAARMLDNGLAIGATNMAQEAFIQSSRHQELEAQDIATAGFIGFALGAPLGLLSRAENAAMTRAANEGQLANEAQGIGSHPGMALTHHGEALKAAGLNRTGPLADSALNHVDEGYSGAHVGSAQADELLPENQLTHVSIFGKKLRVPRFSYAGILGASENAVTKDLSRSMAFDAVGHTNGAAVRATGTELAEIERKALTEQFALDMSDSFLAHSKEKGLNVVTRQFEYRQFQSDVADAIRGAEAKNAHVAKAANAAQKVYTDALARLKAAGVEGAENILPNTKYLTRQFDHDGITLLTQRFGKAQLEQVIARAFVAAQERLTPEKAAGIAKVYLNTTRELAYGNTVGHSPLSGDSLKVLEAKLRATGLDDDSVQIALTVTSGNAPPAGPSMFKYRADLDELITTPLKDLKTGETVDVAFKELLVNDASALVSRYAKQAGGLIGFAKVGIKSEADFKARLQEVIEHAEEKGLDRATTKREVQYLQDLYDFAMGKPMSAEPHGRLARVTRSILNFNFARLMGQAGVAQVGDMGTIMSVAGVRAFNMHIGEFKNIVTLAKGGQLPDDLAKDLIKMGGMQAEDFGHHPFANEFNDPFNTARGFGARAEAGTIAAARFTAHAGGLAMMNNGLRQVAARAVLQSFTDFAHGVTKLTPALEHRLATAGLPKSVLPEVLDDLKKYVTVDTAQQGKITRIDWEQWHTDRPAAAEEFRVAMWREARRAVQEHTIGEKSPYLNGTIGRILTQFRTFSLVAHEKQLLSYLNHRDSRAGFGFMGASLMASLAYIGQTSLNYAGNQAELDKRLTLEAIGKASFTKAGYSALLPDAIDFTSAMTTGDPVFKYAGRNTQLGTGFLTANPTTDLISVKALGTIRDSIQAASKDDRNFTKQNMKNSLGLVFPNLFVIRNFINAASDEFPTSPK